MSDKNEMVRGGIRFGPGGRSTKVTRGEIVDLVARVTRLEARLRLAEEVCESVERYRDGGADEEWAITLLAVKTWRKARGK